MLYDVLHWKSTPMWWFSS